MKCSKCFIELGPEEDLNWECNSCHQVCRANLTMLEQIQEQKDRGYTDSMVKCPFCGASLDDGEEKIHWVCSQCGEKTTGTIKNFLKPDSVKTVSAEFPTDESMQQETFLTEEAVPVKEPEIPLGDNVSADESGAPAKETRQAKEELRTQETGSFGADTASLGGEPEEQEQNLLWLKLVMGAIGFFVAASVLVGVVIIVSTLISPTRRFSSAVEAEDYAKALEIYENSLTGDRDDERMAENAVERVLYQAFHAYQGGTGDKAAYDQIKEFAENEMKMDVSDYELAAGTQEPVVTAEPTQIPEATDTSVVTTKPEVSETPTVTPSVTATPEVTETPAVSQATESPVESETPDVAKGNTSESDVDGVIRTANDFVKKKKFKKAYQMLSRYKDTDTTGKVKKELSSVGRKWKKYNISQFKKLAEKLTIQYYAGEKRYHIVPRGYYTQYHLIKRSNNVGGIGYLDTKTKKVTITYIGKKSQLSAFGKRNRKYLQRFRDMLKEYPYLYKEI